MTVFSAGLSSMAKQPEAAKALIKFLTTPTAQALFKSKGMDVS
jgi:molybdate transport system substrate-binding protein